MTPQFFRASVIAVAVAALGLISRPASAQSIATFLGTSNENWTTAGNWNPAAVPSGTGVYALINSQTVATLRIFYPSTSIPTAPVLPIGAISLLPSLASPTGTLSVQNNSTGTSGTMRFYGVNTTVDGVTSRFILINSSTLANVQFTQTNAGQVFELFTNGAIHVTAGAQLTLTPPIRNGTTSAQSVTKTGAGLLAFSGTTSETSTYSGGFVLDGGSVQWSNSGGASANPFGVGPLTLRSGTLRSTTTSSRSINSSVILDGTATFGSTDAGFTGNITVNSSGGALTTTVASDSVITIVAGGSTAWNQSTSGGFGITKAGTGLLRFTPLSTLAHTGSTVVQAGTLIMAGNLASASVVSVLNGASLFGTGTIAGATSIASGGTFSPGAVAGATGLITFGTGGLTLGGQTLMEISGTTRGVDFDAVNLGGTLGYGGALSLVLTGTFGDLTAFDLFDFTGAAGDFSSVTASGSYGSLTFTNDGFGVWSSGPTGVSGQTLTFTQSTGVFSVVPEPSAALLGGLGAAAVAGRTWRRSRRKCGRAA